MQGRAAVDLQVYSSSCKLDLKRKNRSFQDEQRSRGNLFSLLLKECQGDFIWDQPAREGGCSREISYAVPGDRLGVPEKSRFTKGISSVAGNTFSGYPCMCGSPEIPDQEDASRQKLLYKKQDVWKMGISDAGRDDFFS